MVGARPQFIKAAAVSREIRSGAAGLIDEVIVHTGQHYDENMSQVFFDELEIPATKYDLGISGGRHGAMTGRMLEAVEEVLVDEGPDGVLIYGDTNSTLAGALAAAKLHLPIAHVEAGLRSFNMRMPEEVNRILADRLSTLLFCPTSAAVANLAREGIAHGVHHVGDVMYDAALHYGDRARRERDIVSRLGLTERQFVLATCHREENTDNRDRLESILAALSQIAQRAPVVFPIHPRTRQRIASLELDRRLDGLVVLDPLPFLDLMALEQSAAVIITDSGGMQKEAYFFGVPCVTMRGETEWVETLPQGRNVLTGADSVAITAAATAALDSRRQPPPDDHPYGAGDAAKRIVARLAQGFC